MANDSSTTRICIAAGIFCLAITAMTIYNQIVDKATDSGRTEQEISTKADALSIPRPARTAMKKKEPTHRLLTPGAQFTVGHHKTDENMAHIVDRVCLDPWKRIMVARILEVDDEEGIVTASKLILPETLPDVFNTSDWEFDRKYLMSEYIQLMLAVGHALGTLDPSKNSVEMLTVGLGGGTLNNYVRYNYDNVNVTAVEIDASMVELAKKYFGYVEDERQHCVLDDGVHFVHECVKRNRKFDVIIVDACENVFGFMRCPVEPFLDPDVARSMSESITEDGVLMVNHLAVGEGAPPSAKVQAIFEEFFAGCRSLDVPDHFNKMILCVKSHSQSKYIRSDKFKSDVLNQIAKLFLVA